MKKVTIFNKEKEQVLNDKNLNVETTAFEFDYKNTDDLLNALLSAFKDKALMRIVIGFYNEFQTEDCKSFNYRKIHHTIRKKWPNRLYEIEYENNKKRISYIVLADKNSPLFYQPGYEYLKIENLQNETKYKIFNLLLDHIIYDYYISNHGGEEIESLFKEDNKLMFCFNAYLSTRKKSDILKFGGSKESLFLNLYRLDLHTSLKSHFFNFRLVEQKYVMSPRKENDQYLGLEHLDKKSGVLIWVKNAKYIDINSLESLDVRHDAKSVFMEFPSLKTENKNEIYMKCKLYFLNKINDLFLQFFQKNHIKLKNTAFKANDVLEITLNEKLPLTQETIIINLRKDGDFLLKDRKLISKVFKLYNADCSFYQEGKMVNTTSCLQKLMDDITRIKNQNILFFSNESVFDNIKENMNTLNINPTDFLYKSPVFGEVYKYSKKDKNKNFVIDFYTALKYNHLLINNSHKSLQNFEGKPSDLFEIKKGSSEIEKSKKAECFHCILNSDIQDWIQPILNGKEKRPLLMLEDKIKARVSPKFTKIIKELSIKELLAKDNGFSINLNIEPILTKDKNNALDGNYQMIYIYNKKTSGHKEVEKIIGINFLIKGGQLIAEPHQLLNKMAYYHFLPKYQRKKDGSEILYDDAFVLIDKKTNEFITYSINSPYTKQLLSKKDSYICDKMEKGETINRDQSKTPIPFFTLGSKSGKENMILVQNIEGKLFFFIPSNDNLNSKLLKSQRIYYAEVKDGKNNIVTVPEESKIYKVFFSTFSKNIIKDDNTKINLLEKLIKTLIFN